MRRRKAKLSCSGYRMVLLKFDWNTMLCYNSWFASLVRDPMSHSGYHGVLDFGVASVKKNQTCYMIFAPTHSRSRKLQNCDMSTIPKSLDIFGSRIICNSNNSIYIMFVK